MKLITWPCFLPGATGPGRRKCPCFLPGATGARQAEVVVVVGPVSILSTGGKEKEKYGPTTTTTSACLAPVAPGKKHGRGMSFIPAMMLTIRTNSSSKKAGVGVTINVATADTVIKTILARVCPLHLHLDYKHPLLPHPPPTMVLESYYDVHIPPPSPCRSETVSHYASAEDLLALDTSEKKEDEDGCSEEPNAIDMKAEEFIAMFYKQMRLQQSDTLKMIEEQEQPTTVEEKAIAEESTCVA